MPRNLPYGRIHDYAAGSDQPVLLVTDDLKDDWYSSREASEQVRVQSWFVSAHDRSTEGYHQLGFA